MMPGTQVELRPQPFPPVRTHRKVLKTIRPGPSQEIWGYCIGQEPWGHETHWWDGGVGKKLCLPPCPRCELWKRTGEKQHRPRWYAWIDVMWPATGWCVAFEITKEAHEECVELSQKRTPLRGKIIRLRRLGRSAFGRVVCKIEEANRQLALPRAVDLADWARMAFEVEPFSEQELVDRKSRGAGE